MRAIMLNKKPLIADKRLAEVTNYMQALLWKHKHLLLAVKLWPIEVTRLVSRRALYIYETDHTPNKNKSRKSLSSAFLLSVYKDGYIDVIDLSLLRDAYKDTGYKDICRKDCRAHESYQDAFLWSCKACDNDDFTLFKRVSCELMLALTLEFPLKDPSIDYSNLVSLEHYKRNKRKLCELTSRDILVQSDRKSQVRSRSLNIVARYMSFDKETGEIKYNVTSQTKAGKSYIVTFQLDKWDPDTSYLDDEIQHGVKGNIKIDCTCPAFLYQGYKYIASMKGSSIELETRPPKETNPDRKGLACKHILKAIESFNQDYDKFRAESKGLNQSNLSVYHTFEIRNKKRKSNIKDRGCLRPT